MSDEEHRQRHHQRIRWTKALLRFVPRRAVFHRYPLIGRFAAYARSRPFLWSFKAGNLTRAYYAGAILALLPVMGLQLPLALGCAVVLRTNLMVLGGMQFITNPATVWIYGGTWWVGDSIIQATGFGETPVPDDRPIVLAPPFEGGPDLAEPGPEPAAPVPPRWSHRIGRSVNALVLGGIVCGIVLGALLDLGTRLLSGRGYLKRRVPVSPSETPRETGADSGDACERRPDADDRA